jgi:lincosamide nucleotidyltransferase A/C/D/E
MSKDDPEMTASDVIEIAQLLDQNRIDVWIDGGWGVDALLGEQTRTHRDLDIAVQHKDAPRLRALLEARGFKDAPREDTRDCNFVLGDDQGHQIDIHSYTFDSVGNHVFGVEYPAESLTGTGSVNGRPVRCISPEWMVKFHTGYEVDENDYRDVLALCRRFGIKMPSEYRKFETFEPGAITYEGDLASNYPMARMVSAETAETWSDVLRPFITTFDHPIVLDLGCGAGRFSTLIVERFGGALIGIDLSIAMIKTAMRNSVSGKAQYAVAEAERLPLAGSSIDVAWISQVVHHIRDRRACAAEIRRVLRSNGFLLIRGTFGDRLDGFPTLFKFFPGARRLTAKFPTVGEVSAVFETEGFSLESANRVRQKTCESLREFAARTKLRADSTLVLLPDSEFEACQTALEEAANSERVPEPVIETIELLVLRPL